MRHRALLVLALASGCGTAAPTPSSTPDPRSQPPGTATAGTTDIIADTYGEAASAIIERARLRRESAWTRLEELTVHIGPRLAGSEALARAIEWAAETMKEDGHEAVRVEKVMVPHWVRGAESAHLVAPRRQRLRIVGLGGSVPTPPGGVRAEIVVVRSKEELERRKSEIAGKMVVFDVPMAPYDRDKGDGYDAVYEYRKSGADWAAAHGAVAILMRSLTTDSLSTPHTGGLTYGGKVKKIPAAAITTEAAGMLRRLAARGPVEVELSLASETRPDAESGNVIAELRGREKPEEIVLIGAHIDSWDTSPGAHDDAGGCVVMMEALAVLRELDLRPRRTIRVVLFTNEENGIRGALQYAKDHAAEIPNHVVGLESDGGVFAPRGFLVEGGRGLETARRIATLLAPIKATEVREGFSGVDLIPLVAAGVPGVGHWVEAEDYFDLHHTAADTIDKVDPAELADNVAAVAVFAYVVAEMPERFGSR
jgi:carboxypeptidase Q